MKSDPRFNSPRRFTVVSTCPELWGGSEELWSGAACVLAERGHSVSCFKTALDEAHPRVRRLKSLSCAVRSLRRLPLPQPLVTRFHLLSLALHLTARRPELVIVSQGDNYDGLHFGYLCRKLRIPYILISQKATDHFWPPDRSRLYRRAVFEGAARCFFVSEHNRRLTEEQIGADLTNAEVVRNPYLVPADGPLPWPGREDECLRLACVARLYLLDKGQDILLRVLARDKWKGRAMRVSFFGRGINGEALADLAAKLGVRNVSFEGQTDDVPGIWKNHHALVLPSRAEGLPLSLVEAMMCGRPAVVTNVGGSAEVIDDRVTGFLAAPVEDSLDAALEEAWARRRELSEMGRLASVRIRELVQPDPAKDFADVLLEVADALAEAKSGRAASGRLSQQGASASLYLRPDSPRSVGNQSLKNVKPSPRRVAPRQMTKGLVSIIIPTYNRADYVVEAICSAKAQTYPLKQIIVVDDGSCDDTARRVSEVGGVEYYYQVNRGQGTARNHGLHRACGEYVASLDSDDLWDADFLARSVECLETHQLDFVFTNWTKVRGGQSQPSEWLRDGKWRKYQTRRQGEWSLLGAAEVRKLFLKICPAPSSSLLIRRDAIVSGWGEHMQIADDWYMILEMSLHRPCRAAFSLTPRWRKRIDGRNVYDGRPFAEAARKLHLHDYHAFRRDFRMLLTRRERLTLAGRESAYRLRLLLHRSAKTDLAARLKIPAIIAKLRNPAGTFINNSARTGGGFVGDD